MHLFIIALTVLVALLQVSQFILRRGTRMHAARGALLAVSSVALVVLVAVLSFRLGVHWSIPFAIHLAIGSLYFVFLFGTVIAGFLLYNGALIHPATHRFLAWGATMLLVAALVTSVISANHTRKHFPRQRAATVR
jgi:hypothetical protein